MAPLEKMTWTELEESLEAQLLIIKTLEGWSNNFTYLKQDCYERRDALIKEIERRKEQCKKP